MRPKPNDPSRWGLFSVGVGQWELLTAAAAASVAPHLLLNFHMFSLVFRKCLI